MNEPIWEQLHKAVRHNLPVYLRRTPRESEITAAVYEIFKTQLAERDAEIARLRDALRGLIDAHREVFKRSIFAGFAAGKSSFHKAWTVAREALGEET